MLILAFDTSGTAGTAALLDGKRVLAEIQLDTSRRSARTLAPAIGDLLAHASVDPNAVGLVATTIGPGSFTGLRIGVTTAKTFAYAVGAAVIGLSTLEVIAAGLPAALVQGEQEIHTVLDAQRGELFAGRFRAARCSGDHDLLYIERLAADRIVAAESWVQSLPARAVAAGPGLRRFAAGGLPKQAAEDSYWEPRAAAAGRLAWRYYQAGRRDDLWRLAPQYLRASYAEEKAAARPATS